MSFVSKGEQKQITVRDCQEYCLGTKCRHQLIAQAFGEETEPCKISCDFCVNPKAVEEGIEVASSHKKETVDNWRSSRKKLLKKIGKAASSQKRSNSADNDNAATPRFEPVKKVMKVDFKSRTMSYVDESRGSLYVYFIKLTSFSFS